MRALTVLMAAALLAGCSFMWQEDLKLANMGYDAMMQKNYVEAERLLNEAMAVNPDNPNALLNMGVVYQNTGRDKEARQMYQRLIYLNPGDTAGFMSGPRLVDLAKSNMQQMNTVQFSAFE